jgi:hypothetical protein
MGRAEAEMDANCVVHTIDLAEVKKNHRRMMMKYRRLAVSAVVVAAVERVALEVEDISVEAEPPWVVD